MTDFVIHTDSPAIHTGVVTGSAVIVFVAIVASVFATHLFMVQGRGHVAYDTRSRRWEHDVPEDVSRVESAVYGVSTSADQSLRNAYQRLASYGWANRKAGRVHIPIDVAQSLYLKREEAGR